MIVTQVPWTSNVARIYHLSQKSAYFPNILTPVRSIFIAILLVIGLRLWDHLRPFFPQLNRIYFSEQF